MNSFKFKNITTILITIFLFTGCGLKGGDTIKSAPKAVSDTKTPSGSQSAESGTTLSDPVNYKAMYAFAGSSSASGNVDGQGLSARFSFPTGNIAFDADNNMYIADYGNSSIRKISSSGVTSSFLTGLSGPTSIAIDSTGNIYASSYGSQIIKKITPLGVDSIFAGNIGNAGYVNDSGTAAKFNGISDLAFDSKNNLFVVDSGNSSIRKITPAGAVTTFAGSGIQGSSDGTGLNASFYNPSGIAIDSKDNLYVTDEYNHLIRKISPSGEVTKFAGTGTYGTTDGALAEASFALPLRIAIDKFDNIVVYQALSTGNAIRLIQNGAVSTIPNTKFLSSGSGHNASFGFDKLGNLYATHGHLIVKLINQPLAYEPYQTRTTLAGTPSAACGFVDGTGSAAQFCNPQGNMVIDVSGNIYLTDTGNNAIRKITPAGVVTTFAGSGAAGGTDGTGVSATFSAPRGIVMDSSGNFFVTDTNLNTIRKITSAGVVSTFAGMMASSGSQDGTGTAAQFKFNGVNGSIAIDKYDNLYIGDFSNHTIRKITPSAVVTTFAGTAPNAGSTDAVGAAASFYYPNGVTVDNFGNIFVAEGGNLKIRKIDSGKVVTTFAGTGVQSKTDGAYLSATFGMLSSIIVDNLDNKIVLENSTYVSSNNSMLRMIQDGNVSSIPNTAFKTDSSFGLGIDSSNNIYTFDGNSIIKLTK